MFVHECESRCGCCSVSARASCSLVGQAQRDSSKLLGSNPDGRRCDEPSLREKGLRDPPSVEGPFENMGTVLEYRDSPLLVLSQLFPQERHYRLSDPSGIIGEGPMAAALQDHHLGAGEHLALALGEVY